MHFDFGKILQRTHRYTHTFFYIYLYIGCLRGDSLKLYFLFVNLRNSKMFVARKGKKLPSPDATCLPFPN